MSRVTMVYDTGATQYPKPTDDSGKAIVSLNSVRSVRITLAYDNSSDQTTRVGIDGVVTTCTYVDSGYSGLENWSRAACSDLTEHGSLEEQLIAKLLTLLRNPPQVGQPLWWHVWKTVAEDRWLRSQQVAIAHRLVRQQQLIDEMCQFSTIHLGRVFEQWPSLGLALDHFPSQFPRRTQRIIRRDFVTWLRVRSNERRRFSTNRDGWTRKALSWASLRFR